MIKKLIRKMLTASGGPLFPWLLNTEWVNDWKFRTTPASRSRVLSGKGVETDKQYTTRRKQEETKRTWRSDAADIAHGIGEGVLALHPYTAIPYFGAKVGLDFLNGTYGWHTALNASVPLFHLAPQAVGLREATNVALEDAANAGSKTARNWRVAREINLTTKNKPNIEVPKPIIRTRLGDVEVDNPQLAYRLIGEGGGKNFLETGYAYTPLETLNMLAYKNGTFKPTILLKIGYEPGWTTMRPMYSQGKLWFGAGKGDLITTAQPLRYGNSKGGVTKSATKAGTRRVSDYHGEVTPENASVYTWVPRYGYKKIVQEPSTSLAFFERKPAAKWSNGRTAPKITAENAASITPEQWTAAQDAAIARGNMTEAQRLRDLHADVKGYNSSLPLYHGSSEKNITAFDPNAKAGTLEGSGGTTFFTPNFEAADTYAKGKGVLEMTHDPGKVYKVYSAHKNPKIIDYDGASYLGTGTKLTMNAGDGIMRRILNPKGGGHFLDDYTVYTYDKLPIEGLEYPRYYAPPRNKHIVWEKEKVAGSTSEEAAKAMSEGYDVAILKNVDEGVGPNSAKIGPIDDYAIRNPQLIKSADAVTYDDNGVRIPLGKRDNFNINDIRYGLFPFGIIGTGAYLQSQTQWKKQGGKMNVIEQFKEGGQIRKMLTAAGGPLQLTPEELKYLEWSKMTSELKREYRTNRAKSHLLSGPNITNFWEAFQTYIGNRDPENPHLNTGEAPNPGWGKQGITGLHKMMVKLPEAKLVLLAPLAGRSRAAATLKMEDIVKAQLHRDEVYKRWTSLYKLLYDPTPTTFRTKPARIKRLETDISKTNGRTLAGGKGHAGGSYNSKSHTINVTTSKTVSAKNLEDIGFHEGIHSYGLGESPSYYWKTRYLNFPEGTNPYSLDPREIATHGLLQGLNLGIKVGQPYPGKEGLIKIIENRPDGLGFGGIPYTLYNNAKTNADYRRLWSLLNGTFKYGGMLQLLKKGSGIHIKKKNRGKFTSYCGGKVTDECIRKAKASGNPTLVKRATFAANARKWKHLQGGTIVNGLMDIYRSIKQNQAIDASMDAMRLQAELDKQKLFYNEYKKLLGLQTDRSDIVNANKAYNEAKNVDYSDIEQLLLDLKQSLLSLKQENTSNLIGSIANVGSYIADKAFAKKALNKNGTPSSTPKGMLNTDPKTFFNYESNI